jgi:hypothetical protein
VQDWRGDGDDFMALFERTDRALALLEAGLPL